MLLPEDDGKTHINIYSKGATRLGRTLSNFAHTPFVLDGIDFASVEGWWYWKLTGEHYLTTLYGSAAKVRGKQYLEKTKRKETILESDLYLAYRAKLEAFPELHSALKRCTLPLKHYYVYGGSKVVEPKEWQWTATLWNEFK